MDVLQLLVDKGVIDAAEVGAIRNEAAESGEGIEAVLEKRGINSKDVLAYKGEALDVPTRSIDGKNVPREALKYIPEESATHYKFVPLGVADGVLEVGIVDPDNLDALDALSFISSKAGIPYKVFLISEKDFESVLEQYKGLSSEVGQALSDLETELTGDESPSQEEVDTRVGGDGGSSDTTAGTNADGSRVIKEDAPVTKIVATILRYAAEGRASDIHIEPLEEQVRIRFRVDGILKTNLTLPKKVHRAVVARIKILASVKLDERRKPLDGRFSATVDDRRIDFRVSTFPTYYGEKVVMRLLDREKGVIKIDELGLTEENLKKIRKAIKRPFGMILISGPTGSGKTTTLNAMLHEFNREEKNVISLEDPVEYNVDGVSQSQVRPEIGYTFASGLRSVLRQDPDIIMVGEIRDKETAQLAIQAALTGHLVLSTIHTNNAVGIVPRLIDMGIDPYLIAPTLAVGIAQRLVRTLCEGAGKPIPVEGSFKMMVEKEFEDLPDEFRSKVPIGDTLYEAESTPECPNGTRGRIGAFEVLEMDEELERAVLDNANEDDIYEIARKKGMLTMKEDAMIKAFNKVIPFEEVNTLGGALAIDEEAPASEEQQAATSEQAPPTSTPAASKKTPPPETTPQNDDTSTT